MVKQFMKKVDLKKNKEFFTKLKTGTKEMFKDLKDKDKRKKQIPNLLTFSRVIIPIIVVILSIIATITSISALLGVACGLTLIGASSDALDGFVARKFNCTSEYGKILDQFTDKFFSILIGLGLTIVNPIIILPILGELCIGTVNFYNKIKYPNLDQKSTLIGRIKQWPLFITLILTFISGINPALINFTLSGVLATITLQALTIESYIDQARKENENITNNDNNTHVQDNNEEDKENEKEKMLESPKKSKLEQLKDLKSVLNEITGEETKEDKIDNSFQKIKK